MKLFTYAGVTVEVTDEQEKYFDELVEKLMSTRSRVTDAVIMETAARKLKLRYWINW